jgi:anhydro-N-acetylmuramic acid kinase
MQENALLVGGLLSGTSLDGIDAILLRVTGADPAEISWDVVGFLTESYSPEERERIARAIASGGVHDLALLGRDLALRFGATFLRLLESTGTDPADVRVLGSHGQTVWHDPPTEGLRGATLQVGDPSTLAETTGCPVVSDVRARDMAAGGHGAPLVPWADWALLRRPGTGLALQNLGGMGNVTFLPSDGRLDGVRGFDTGPGVALLDAVARLASEGRHRWDEDGERAARGRVRPDLLDELLSDPFFDEHPPRSTGRERFGDERVARIVERENPESEGDWDDILATLALLTARSVADSYRRFLPQGGVHQVVLTGGGARNPTLVRLLASELAPLPVLTGGRALGIDPDAREAAAFALLAWAHVRGIPANVPAVTGAEGPRILGSLTPGRAGA